MLRVCYQCEQLALSLRDRAELSSPTTLIFALQATVLEVETAELLAAFQTG